MYGVKVVKLERNLVVNGFLQFRTLDSRMERLSRTIVLAQQNMNSQYTSFLVSSAALLVRRMCSRRPHIWGNLIEHCLDSIVWVSWLQSFKAAKSHPVSGKKSKSFYFMKDAKTWWLNWEFQPKNMVRTSFEKTKAEKLWAINHFRW